MRLFTRINSYSIKNADMKRQPILPWSLKDAIAFNFFLLQSFTNP